MFFAKGLELLEDTDRLHPRTFPACLTNRF